MWTFVAGADNLQNIDWALRREYLLANGLGGYAASSILGCNTRRYHGLLVAAMKPPLRRRVLLSHLDELLVLPEGRHYLNTTEYRDGFYPDGFRRLSDFRLDPLPVWRWRIGGVELTKRLLLIHHADCLMVHYRAAGNLAGARLVISPFVAMRDFHDLARRNDSLRVEPHADAAAWRVPIEPGADLYIHAGGARAVVEPLWYHRIYHRMETERGQDDLEDLLRLGYLTVDLADRPELLLTAAVGLDEPPLTFAEAFQGELLRRKALIRAADPRDQREEALVLAADQFLVSRRHGDAELTTVLAGYPWFADWGRDAMVSLPGLCLATRRNDLARQVLELFAGLVDRGMLPNCFDDDNTRALYNSVDAALWFIQACAAAVRAAADPALLRGRLWNAVVAIINAYHAGTRHHIRADADGLILAGDHATQLTWMDAKVADVPVTPRHGKAVEVNALWVSALYLADEWARALGEPPPNPVPMRDAVRDAFRAAFWNPEAGCLYDCLTDGRPDPRIRPNQILAVSLPHAPIAGEQARSVVRVVRQKLLTPRGLRTLAPDDPAYRGAYAGSWTHRDAAYHQGTAWAWLIGPYVDALMLTAESPFAARSEAQQVIDAILSTLDHGAVGTIAEIFDGDPPHLDRGCVAQAWSVAEILRVKRAYDL